MATQQVKPNEVVKFRFVNPMPDGEIAIQFCADDNRLEIDLPCGSRSTANRLYIEKTDEGFFVYSHNHNLPGSPEIEREINCEF